MILGTRTTRNRVLRGAFTAPLLVYPLSFCALTFLCLSTFALFGFSFLPFFFCRRFQTTLSAIIRLFCLSKRYWDRGHCPLSSLEVGHTRILIEKKYTLLSVVSVCEIHFLKILASLRDQFGYQSLSALPSSGLSTVSIRDSLRVEPF